MNIFFDFDGTLIDARQRLYYLFKSLVKECDLTFDEYWEIKRRQLGHQYILSNKYAYSRAQIDSFTKKWMQEVEQEQWISMDKPFDHITDYIEELSKTANLYLVTARQKPEMVLKQIDSFKWNKYFTDYLVTRQEREKEDLISAAVTVSTKDYMVGDTGKDIMAGKALGMNTIGVLSGFRNKEQLLKYNPDLIIDKITDFTFEIN